MNILDESDEIFAIRVDQNRDGFFKCHVLQKFKNENIEIVQIVQDFNELNINKKTVYKVVARDENDILFVWQKFENPSNVQITMKRPNKSDIELLNELLQDGSFWSKPNY